ncbi:unnamed protein product [Spirodela intermedia]|uniref:Uncharacterized protein n=1 Tax=Spirodela intermedia TaxID=51605 RepID=A0A7I8J5S3_SPIIN|nr:unnamed protein product [Spirodela intermedia]CAA6664792.1 unnamed protein product [Spirodela intermedia]
MAAQPADPSMETTAPQASITRERKLNVSLQDELPKPHLARAQAAVDKFHPKGTEGVCNGRAGLRAIGCNFFFSIMSAFLINFGLSYTTQPGWLRSPLLSINIRNIHRCKHGSDSETYDTEEGQAPPRGFEPSKFEAIFTKYAATNPDALSKSELDTMLKANRNFTDFNGCELPEWQLLYVLGEGEHGFLHRETVREVYDGSLFEKLEKAGSSLSKRA